MNNEPVAIVELGGEVTWLTDVLPYKAKLYTHPVKELTLTDDEAMDLWNEASSHPIDFARAILRKAQE